MKNILISGSLVYDRIMDFPGRFADHILPEKIHNINLSFVIKDLKENFGGTAGNIAYNLALLKERPSLIACVGRDFAPYEAWLKKNGIETGQLKRLKDKLTSAAFIITDKSDNQIAGFNPGAMAVARGSFDGGLLKEGLAIIAPGNNEDMEKYAALYKKKKISYIFDPGQALSALEPAATRNSLEGAEILIGNDYEVELIKKKTGLATAEIIDKVNILIITKGEKGSEIFTKTGRFEVRAAKPERVVDPTGAGDAYRAGLIKGLLAGLEIKEAARLASAVASFAVECYGGQTHKFSWKSLKKRYGESYGESIKNF